jgi:transcriptional regulator with GAF, ATPase, and Fis domain
MAEVYVQYFEVFEHKVLCAMFRDVTERVDLRSENQRLNILLDSLMAEKTPGIASMMAGNKLINSKMVGKSPVMKKVFKMISQVAMTPYTVLILGETGTGKELVAEAVHRLSDRSRKPLVKLNCAALPANLIETELFGYEKGAFTGAATRKIGKFEAANNGSIFLDEIGEMPLELQTKLLRVIQEKEFERVGGNHIINCDVRIIVATNISLEEAVKKGKFRRDLYYRINTFPIDLPPLRERKEDIPDLVNHFIDKFCTCMKRKKMVVSESMMDEFMLYNWPGNIRELQNIVERLCILTSDETLVEPEEIFDKNRVPQAINEEGRYPTLVENETRYFLKVLRHCHWRIFGEGGAAEIMDMNPRTLISRMKKLGIKKPDEKE